MQLLSAPWSLAPLVQQVMCPAKAAQAAPAASQADRIALAQGSICAVASATQ